RILIFIGFCKREVDLFEHELLLISSSTAWRLAITAAPFYLACATLELALIIRLDASRMSTSPSPQSIPNEQVSPIPPPVPVRPPIEVVAEPFPGTGSSRRPRSKWAWLGSIAGVNLLMA